MARATERDADILRSLQFTFDSGFIFRVFAPPRKKTGLAFLNNRNKLSGVITPSGRWRGRSLCNCGASQIFVILSVSMSKLKCFCFFFSFLIASFHSSATRFQGHLKWLEEKAQSYLALAESWHEGRRLYNLYFNFYLCGFAFGNQAWPLVTTSVHRRTLGQSLNIMKRENESACTRDNKCDIRTGLLHTYKIEICETGICETEFEPEPNTCG